MQKPVCDPSNNFDIDHGPLLPDQSHHNGQIIETNTHNSVTSLLDINQLKPLDLRNGDSRPKIEAPFCSVNTFQSKCGAVYYASASAAEHVEV